MTGDTVMENRTGEKIGWVGGWLGGFIWLLILAIIWLLQDRRIEGMAGLLLVSTAVGLVFLSAPWKHPITPYWKLMLPIYVVLFGSVALALWSFGGAPELGLSWWSLSWVLLLLIPFGTVGKRRWNAEPDPPSPNQLTT